MENENIEIILRLFDQVKDSSDKSDKQIEGLSSTIRELFNSSSSPSHSDIVRLINELQPKVFLMENVSGQVKGKMKGLFIEIMKQLKSTG